MLTVNQPPTCTSYRELEDWGKAMESVVPLRKVHKDEGENAAEEETEDSGTRTRLPKTRTSYRIG